MPRKHAGVGGTVRFVAGRASLLANGRMFECERPCLFGMATETAGLIAGSNPEPLFSLGGMGTVTIYAAHALRCGPTCLGKRVGMRLLKRGPDIGVAPGALRGNAGIAPESCKLQRLLFVNGVALHATDQVSCMAASKSAGMNGLILMAA